MNILTRFRRAIHTLTEDDIVFPDSADLEEGCEEETEETEGHVCQCQHNPKDDAEAPESPEVCGWLEIDCRCKIPLGDGENMPSGCSAACPARIQNHLRTEQRRIDAQRLYH